MAESQGGGDSGEKTEKASPQKLRNVRRQGQAARSRDWATAVGMLCGLKLLVLLVPGYLEDFRRLFGQAFVDLAGDGTQDNAGSQGFATSLWLIARMVAPLLAIPAVVMLASLLPGGWAASSRHLMPKWQRLSPAQNLGRLFTKRHAADVIAAVAKATLLCVVLWYASIDALNETLALQARTLDRALLQGATLLLDKLLCLVAVFVLFALIDLPLQAWFFSQRQRMSKQEAKEELRGAEGRPEVRQRVRRLQQQMARRSVRKTVPGADVVLVNPEHYAVALTYDEARAEAPFLVAKGIDDMALYIRAVALEHGVPVVEQPPLARAVYHTSQVNQQIPAPLYRAVALVLGHVLQIRAFQAGLRKTAPVLPRDLGVPANLSEREA